MNVGRGKTWLKEMGLERVLPLVYRLYARKPIEKEKVIFVEYRRSTLPETYREIWNRLQNQGGWRLVFHTLRRMDVSTSAFIRRNLALVKDMATAKTVFVCEGMTLIGCLPVRKETTVTQLWHACGAFKRFGLSTADRKFGPDAVEHARHPMYKNYTYVTVSSPEVVWAYEEAMGLEKKPGIIRPTGISRTDVFFQPHFLEESRRKLEALFPAAAGKKVILYAPTFRGETQEPKAPLLPDLVRMQSVLQDRYVWVIKQHPSVKERPCIPKETASFACDLSDQMDISALLAAADLCISDYSSLIFEYSLLLRPMLFYAYDLEEYQDWRGFYYPFEEMTPGPVCITQEELEEKLKDVSSWFDPDRIKAFRNKFMSACDGHATDRILNLVFKENTHTV